jgi:hypothetical protein
MENIDLNEAYDTASNTIMVMIHDDGCGEYLTRSGRCPTCDFHPNMQDTAFVPIDADELNILLSKGKTFLGKYRQPIEGEVP